MKVRELYAKVADETNMPVSTVGKIVRVALCELAAHELKDIVGLLRRYRIRK